MGVRSPPLTLWCVYYSRIQMAREPQEKYHFIHAVPRFSKHSPLASTWEDPGDSWVMRQHRAVSSSSTSLGSEIFVLSVPWVLFNLGCQKILTFCLFHLISAYVSISSLDMMAPKVEVGTNGLFCATGYRLLVQRGLIYPGVEQLMKVLFHSCLMSGETTVWIQNYEPNFIILQCYWRS